MGLKELILESSDLPREKVLTPEWPEAGGFVWVRALQGHERDAWEASLIVDPAAKQQKADLHNMRARLCAKAICDEDGKRVFTDEEAGPLGCKSAIVLDRIFDVARKLSGITTADMEAAVKN